MEQTDPVRPPVSWSTTIFILATTVGALLSPIYFWHFGLTRGEIALAIAYFVGCGMAITSGYHRLIAHRSYRCHPWLETVFLLLGAAAWQGSALDWAADHVRHHSYTDSHRDTYNIKEGVWHAHVGWLFRKQKPASIPPFLRGDRLLELQDRF